MDEEIWMERKEVCDQTAQADSRVIKNKETRIGQTIILKNIKNSFILLICINILQIDFSTCVLRIPIHLLHALHISY